MPTASKAKSAPRLLVNLRISAVTSFTDGFNIVLAPAILAISNFSGRTSTAITLQPACFNSWMMNKPIMPEPNTTVVSFIFAPERLIECKATATGSTIAACSKDTLFGI